LLCRYKKNKGFEGRVLNDSPGDCQTAPPLRSGVPENEQSEFSGWLKAGESLAACQEKSHFCLPTKVTFFNDIRS
jgi:hypothetical protein